MSKEVNAKLKVSILGEAKEPIWEIAFTGLALSLSVMAILTQRHSQTDLHSE